MEFFPSGTFMLLVLACSGLHFAYGLQCYQCNTANEGEEDCEAIPNGSTKYLQNCTDEGKSCRILQQWIEFTVLNQTTSKRTLRQCSPTEFEPDKPCYYRAGFGGKVNSCSCDQDGCNEAPNHLASIAAITIGLFLTLKVLN